MVVKSETVLKRFIALCFILIVIFSPIGLLLSIYTVIATKNKSGSLRTWAYIALTLNFLSVCLSAVLYYSFRNF